MRDGEEGAGTIDRLANALSEETGCEVKTGEPLASHTSFRIGGPADLFMTVPGDRELERLLPALGRRGLRYFVLGNGTNLLFSDDGFRGAVIRLGEHFRQIARTGRELSAGAAVALPAIARAAADAELAGCEFLAGIPGSLGGAVCMNAGAWGASLSDIVSRVWVVDRQGDRVSYGGAEMAFGYRTSRLLGSGEVVTRVELALHPGEVSEIRRRTAELLEARRRSQPLGVPNAGSVFKNPPGGKAGRLLEEAGVKGLRRGGAEVSRVHANFIVNTGGATAADVLWLVREMQRRVFVQTGVMLEPELRLVGGED
ncbi:MAG: UDP-N-acetylmuramate dehydrogenase [Chitinophagales bacterium]